MNFYQVSDKVPSKVITGVTSKCEREDCCVSVRKSGGTMMGTSDYYDKNGILCVYNPNRFVAELCCCQCWGDWTVNQDGEIVKSS